MRWDVRRAEIDPEFADDVDTIPGPWAVEQGWRSPDTQNGLWQKGRDADGIVVDKGSVVTRARMFQSPHTVTNPLGERNGLPMSLAVDLARIGEDGKLHWDWEGNYPHQDWRDLWDYCHKHPRLHSGISFADGDHVEAVKWRTTRDQLIQLKKW